MFPPTKEEKRNYYLEEKSRRLKAIEWDEE